VLWIAFVLVHVGVAVLGWHQPNAPMGDVYLVYERWSAAWLNGGWIDPSVYGLTQVREYVGFVGIDEPWVYPQLAIIPMLLARAFAFIDGYTPAWAILVTIIDALAFALLVGRGRSRGRVTAAWFWLAFLALIGPIGLYRIDTVTVALAVAGGLWLVGRPWLGSSLLAIGVWIKVWPAAIIAAAVIALRRRFAVIGGAIAVTVVTAGTVALLGGGSHILGFIGDQTGRGLQIEAPVSSFYLWRSALMLPDSAVFYDPDMLTFQVSGPFLNQMIAIMTPVLVLVMASIAGLGAYKVWRRATFARLFPALTLALVLGFIVFNKVGSPQYQVWIIAPLVLGLVLDRRRWAKPAVLGLLIALLTQIVYPLLYDGLMLSYPYPLPTLMLTLRNAAVVALFIWTVVILVRVPTHRVARAVPSRPSAQPAAALADGA
jgi:hypothetical protein